MANEIVTSFITGQNIDAYIVNEDNQFWYPAGEVFEDWCGNGHVAADYAIALTEVSDSGIYAGDFDQDIPKGQYSIQLKRRSGAEPANSDIPVSLISYAHRVTAADEAGDTHLCTLADVKDRLGLVSAETEHDDVLTRIILGLETIFDSYVRRILLLPDTDITEYYSALGSYLSLNRYPVASITSIKQALDYDFDSVDELVSNEDYRLVNTGRNGIIRRINMSWFEDPDSIEVIYRGGFCAVGVEPAEGETALPADIREAAILQATFMFKRRDDIGLSAVSSQGGSISKFSDMELLPLVKQTLDNYRRPSL